MKIRTSLWGGILFLILSVVILILIPFQVAPSFTLSVGNDPQLMPRIVAIIMIVCSLVLIFQSIILKKETIIEIHWIDEKNAIFALLIMFIFLFCILLLGFLPASFIMIAGFLLFFKDRKPLMYIILFVLAVLIYLLFIKVFNVPLGGGLLFQ
jgi:hypothetical protein